MKINGIEITRHNFQIVHTKDYDYKITLECRECGRPLLHAVLWRTNNEIDDCFMVGRKCARKYGVVWTAKVGPMADDPQTFQRAIEIWTNKRLRERRKLSRLPDGGVWESDWENVKMALGTIKWKEAMMITWRMA